MQIHDERGKGPNARGPARRARSAQHDGGPVLAVSPRLWMCGRRARACLALLALAAIALACWALANDVREGGGSAALAHPMPLTGQHDLQPPRTAVPHWPGIVADQVPSTAAVALLLLGAAGLVAGFLAGLLGIGGSLVTVPALYLLLPALGVAGAAVPLTAVATALTVMLPGALVATAAQRHRGGLDLRCLRAMAPGVAAGAGVGALVALHLDGLLLAMLFVLQSLYYGLSMLRAAAPAPTGARAWIARRAAALPCWSVGPTVGALCSCVGMGCGSLLLPYLVLRGAALRQGAATAGAMNLFVAVGGVAGFAWAQGAMVDTARGATFWPAAVPMALAAMLAAPAGVAAATRLPLRLFRRVLGCVNVLAAAVLLARSLWL